MPGLLIKDLPDAIHARLRRRAKANRRSMTAEALVILERHLAEDAGPPTLEAVDAMRVRGRAPLTDALIREGTDDGRR